jgi:hypothetical protein
MQLILSGIIDFYIFDPSGGQISPVALPGE